MKLDSESMFTESELLPISALQHFLFCERQCALIHLEQSWTENYLTAAGRVLHSRVHSVDGETRNDIKIARGLRLRSLRLGLVGQADVVEFHNVNTSKPLPFPVEYKRGRPKPDDCDRVQLCAQAVCLEEMLNVAVPEGAIYYGTPRRRELVVFNQQLRGLLADTVVKLRSLFSNGLTPPAKYSKKCSACSLLEICKPKATGTASASKYVKTILEEIAQ